MATALFEIGGTLSLRSVKVFSYIAQCGAANPDDLVFPVPSPGGRRLGSSGEFLGAFRGLLSEMKTAAEPWGHRRGYGGQYGYQRRLRTGMDITPWH